MSKSAPRNPRPSCARGSRADTNGFQIENRYDGFLIQKCHWKANEQMRSTQMYIPCALWLKPRRVGVLAVLSVTRVNAPPSIPLVPPQ